MTESQFQLKFGSWIVQPENKPKKTEFYEYKVARGGTFNLKQWREKQGHQIRALYDARGEKGVYHKISDQSMGQKPLDAFFAVNAVTVLVIYFNKYKEFFMLYNIPTGDSIAYKDLTGGIKFTPKKKKEVMHIA